MKKSISCDVLSNLTLSQHLQVIYPALLIVLSILRMFLGFSSFSVDNHSLTTALGSRKFSVAPLLMRAPSVFDVVDKISFIFKVFHLIVDIQYIDSACAATINKGDSKNLNLRAWPAEGHLFLHHPGLVPFWLGPWFHLFWLKVLQLWWIALQFWRVSECTWVGLCSCLGNLFSYGLAYGT